MGILEGGDEIEDAELDEGWPVGYVSLAFSSLEQIHYCCRCSVSASAPPAGIAQNQRNLTTPCGHPSVTGRKLG